jgi:SpoVK/Ycf46/Vps4 family AAA+-type ATPase
MNKEDIEDIARAAAREAIREMLITMGVDTSNHAAMIEMQRDFQSLRSWRQSVQTIQRHSFVTAVGVIIVGLLGMIYMHFFHR